MKSQLIKLFSLLVLTTLVFSCGTEVKQQVKTASSKRPNQAITYPEMASMFKEYDNGQKKVLDGYIKKKSKGKDTIATISEFFTIEELEQYLSYVKRLSAEKEIDLTGIKIFTSAYPSDYKIPEYRNRVTFMLAPTAKIKGKNVAYEPLKSTMRTPVSMQSVLNEYADETTKKVNRAGIFSFQIGSDDSSALNRGQVAPPY